MQTFLPFPDFRASAQVLDTKRLGKQRVEAEQIRRALSDPEYGWRNHPAVKMWQGHEQALIAYRNAMIEEWIRRGYKNTMPILDCTPVYAVPPWMGDPEFHLSHQSNLIRKFPDHYAPLFPGVSPELPYKWPTT